MLQARDVRRFEQSWPKDAVDIDGRGDYLAGDLIERRVHQHGVSISNPRTARNLLLRERFWLTVCAYCVRPWGYEYEKIESAVRLRAPVPPCEPVPSSSSAPSVGQRVQEDVDAQSVADWREQLEVLRVLTFALP